MKSPYLFTAVLLCSLSGLVLSQAQSAPSSSPAAVASASDKHYPDDAYLSGDRYTNPYFGFSFDFPANARLRPVPQPAASDGSVQLAELSGAPPADAGISIVAFRAGSRQGDAKTLLRQALDQQLFVGVEELHSLTKTTLAGHPFYFFETRRGIEQHMFLATELNGYVLRVILAAHDEKVLKQMEQQFQHLHFFITAQLPQYLEADAKPYQGPSVPEHRLQLLHADPPANHIAAGEIDGTVYRNAALGFSYRFPEGWVIQPKGAVEPELARPQTRIELTLDGSTQPAGGAEQQLMRDCSRTLFSAWARRPGPKGELVYDDFGEVTISAIAAECFPSLAFPADAGDQQGFRNFISELALTHPVLRDMRNANIIQSRGSTFLLLRGALAMQIRDDSLSRRVSVAMAVTQRRGHLVLLFFAAPHDSDLQPLLEERAVFDPESRLAKENLPDPRAPGIPSAGNSAMEDKPSSGSTTVPANASSSQVEAAAGSANPPGAVSPTANGNQSGALNSTSADSDSSSSTQDVTSNAPPSLLRPGENIQDQQVKGAPIQRH